MSGVTVNCLKCGAVITVMCGSMPDLCDDCGWKEYHAKQAAKQDQKPDTLTNRVNSFSAS